MSTARSVNAVAVMAERDPVSGIWTLSARLAGDGMGTPVTFGRAGTLAWAHFGARLPAALSASSSAGTWLSRLVRDSSTARELTDAGALFVIDMSRATLTVAGDRLGVQAVHYASGEGGAWKVSTHALWLLREMEHAGGVNDDAACEHFAFGYRASALESVYTGLRTLHPASILTVGHAGAHESTYWETPEASEEGDDVSAGELAHLLRAAMAGAAADRAPFVALTAGRDSLCVSSCAAGDLRPRSGTFGHPDCADRQQGAAVAHALGWPYKSTALCPAEEFELWANRIASHSAGLATASYVDMARFVDVVAPHGTTVLMGEGGECVRDFFHHAGSPLERLAREFMTPAEYLRPTLARRLHGMLDGYPESALARARAQAPDETEGAFALRFYRSVRMPGNFALRHGVLSALRAKSSPFLDSDFIDAAYALPATRFAGSRLHREMIESTRPSLLPFFDRPVQAARTLQEWPERFRGGVGAVVGRLLESHIDDCADVFEPEGVRALARATIAQPSRALYHLLRILSFTLGRRQLRASRAPELERFPTMILEEPAAPAHSSGAPRAAMATGSHA